MEQYILKSALVAEIEKIITDETESVKCFERGKNGSEVQRSNARMAVLMHIRSLLNTIAVKEVDFDAEWKKYFEYRGEIATVNVKHLAKHFFELGVSVNNKAQKGE